MGPSTDASPPQPSQSWILRRFAKFLRENQSVIARSIDPSLQPLAPFEKEMIEGHFLRVHKLMLAGEPEYKLFLVLGLWLGVPGFADEAKAGGWVPPTRPDSETLLAELGRVAGYLASLAEDLASPDAPIAELSMKSDRKPVTVRLPQHADGTGS